VRESPKGNGSNADIETDLVLAGRGQRSQAGIAVGHAPGFAAANLLPLEHRDGEAAIAQFVSRSESGDSALDDEDLVHQYAPAGLHTFCNTPDRI
jgi:hypothetical protein